MLRFFTFFIFCTAFYLSNFGQELIEMKSGENLKVEIVEELELKFRYKKYKEKEGPIYVIYKKDIKKITYPDGKVVSFQSPNSTISIENDADIDNETITGPEAEIQRIKEKSKVYNQKRHLIGFNYAHMILLNIGFTYEFILTKGGFFGLKIPLDFGINVRNTYLKKNNIFSTGLNFNIYPTGQGRVAYLTGPAFRYSIMRDNPNFFNATSSDSTRAHYIGFYINNGVLFQATSFLNFSLGMGLGMRKDITRNETPSTFDLSIDGSIIFRL